MRLGARARSSLAACALLALVACGARSDDAPAPAESPDAAQPAPDAGSGADAAVREDAGADGAAPEADAGPFALTSPRFVDGGTLPAEFTCDGAGGSPPLAWSGVPFGTVELALLVTTVAKDGLKWNWVLYGLPSSPTALAAGSDGGGTAGLTSDGPNLAYSPPCSQGPGAKTYTFTLYALSARPSLPAAANQVTGAVLTDAVSTITLGKAALSVSYTRP